MKSYLTAVLALFSASVALEAATITVTTTDSDAPPSGEKSLKQALEEAQSGDTIAFNIPGDGPHYLPTPAGGYPLLKQDSIKIDGYTQPGSVPNSSPVLQANNAKIQIVLDSRNGNSTLLDFAPDTTGDNTGYGDTESAVLAFYAAKGAEVDGVSILAVPLTGDSLNVKIYGVSFAHGASGHVHGSWIGVDPDGVTLAGPANGVTGYRYQDKSQQPNVNITIDDVIVGVAPKATNARAQLNVITGIAGIPLAIEGNRTRISGNFLNVQPNGLDDFNPAFDQTLLVKFEGHIEIGRGGNDTVIGVDGDGVNDADERNVLGGMLPKSMNGYAHSIEFYSNSPGTGVVLAGNYIGIAVNGLKRFTNGIPALDANGGSAEYRFGSDFNGVSDGIEANVVANNYPADIFPPVDLGAKASSLSFFDSLQAGGSVSARGNKLINNFPFPVNPLKLTGATWTSYYAKALADSATESPAPVLTEDSTTSRLRGTVATPNGDYPTVILDVYQADSEGLATSDEAAVPDYPAFFVQGRTYLGSFVVDSAADLNSAPNQFEFDISRFGGGVITVTANYSKQAAGARGATFLTSPFSNPLTLPETIADAAALNVARIQPDQIILDVDGVPNQDNWEPYASVLGNSTFLIEANTHAVGAEGKQRYAVAFAKATGGQPVIGDGFFADDGTPYRGQINGSRQNGNPGRVAGDKRPGATHIIVGGEASPHMWDAFASDSRWQLGFDRGADGRYGTIQIYDINPATLAQAPLSKALDAANGRLTEGAQQGGQQITRYGGDVLVLDNGNFVSVVADKTKLRNPAGDTAGTTIFASDGSVVTETFAVGTGDIWQNAAAIKGGFVVRAQGVLYFFDNRGNARGSVADSTSGGQFDGGRGDNTRLAGHINSPYVYLAGVTVGSPKVVRLAAWDSRDFSFVASIDVTDAGVPGVTLDRANLAVDALDRVTVAYEAKPDGEFKEFQTLIRLFALDTADAAFTPLTPSFLAFVNNGKPADPSLPAIRTIRPSVSVTTRQILVAAKGEINRANTPGADPDTQKQTTFYTILAHPFPQDDPTAPIDTGRPTVSISHDGANVVIRFTGTLQSSSSVTPANWQTVAGATSPLTLTPAQQAGNRYYRSSQ